MQKFILDEVLSPCCFHVVSIAFSQQNFQSCHRNMFTGLLDQCSQRHAHLAHVHWASCSFAHLAHVHLPWACISESCSKVTALMLPGLCFQVRKNEFSWLQRDKKSFPPYQLGEKTKFLVLLIALANTMGKMLFLSLGKKDEISSVADFARKHHGKNAFLIITLAKRTKFLVLLFALANTMWKNVHFLFIFAFSPKLRKKIWTFLCF